MKALSPYWALNTLTNKMEPSSQEPLSVFPTIVNTKDYTVWCKFCRRWEKIAAFSNNRLLSQCGRVYTGPFTANKSIITYGYNILQQNGTYRIRVKNILVSTEKRKVYENEYELNLKNKKFYRNGKTIIKPEDVNIGLCPSVSEIIESEMAEGYKNQFGLKPTVASKLNGFQRLVGYMLCPFNVNFYQICQHWGLNPYDADFTSLSSGDSSTAENEMFECLGIKPSKSIRKLYQEKPYSVICFAVVKDLGLTDVNILLKTATDTFYNFLKPLMISFTGGVVSYPLRDSLKTFCEDMLTVNGNNQKSLWNSLERTAKIAEERAFNSTIITDGISSYMACRNILEPSEKLDILHEGFNVYTHDFLVRRVHAAGLDVIGANGASVNEVHVKFIIEPKFQELEYKCGENYVKVNFPGQEAQTIKVEDRDRYCFYVAYDNTTLKQIGAAMHNCVGWGYTNSVRDRRCTIVYAKYKDEYRICIEVTPTFHIRQALGPCNTPLAGKDMEAYAEWCKEKHIQFTRAFKIRAAP